MALSKEAAAKMRESQVRWHRDHYDRISVNVPKGKRDEYRAKAEARGASLNALIVSLLESI